MKKYLSILFSVIVLATYTQVTKKALFLGNSYTYVNNMPLLIENLATANGDVLIRDQNTPGGYNFNGHSSNATSLAKIQAEDWDYVVLQAQSQEPSFPPSQVATQTMPYAEILVDAIYANNSCSKPLFFMTWGRQNGDQQNCVFYAPLCTYAGMQQRLRESYLQMTVDNNADCAPVGMAWKKVREDFPTINLYSADESHPSLSGSYLAACVFYVSMYNKTAVGNSYWSTLDSLTAFRLQNIASATVLDSLSVWSIETAPTSFEVVDSIITTCDSVEINGIWYNSNVIISDTNITVGSCGRIINYEISIGSQTIDSLIEFCDSMIFLGSWYFADTLILDTIIGNPCSMYVNYLLKINQGIIVDTLINNICDSIIFEGVWFYADTNFVLTDFCNVRNVELQFLSSMSCNPNSTIDVQIKQFDIFPNPANDFININSVEEQYFSASLYSISGKEIIEKQQVNNSLLNLNVKKVESGIYFVVLYNENGNAIGQKRIVIQK